MGGMATSTRRRSEVTVDGMTCGACATRVQTELDRTPGVAEAQVNFATGRATVVHELTVDDSELRRVIESLGYSVIDATESDAAHDRRQHDLQRRLVVAIALTLPAAALSMISPLQFEGWRWVVAALATPVVFWSGWIFHRATVLNARHRSTTMDTLVSVGSIAAWVWSAVVLVGDVGDGHIYFETGARHRHADPARQVARGQGEAPLGRRHSGTRRSGSAHGGARRRVRDIGRRASSWHAVCRAARRQDRDRRHGRQWPFGDRRLDDHRRARAGRSRHRRPGHRCDAQHQRHARRRGDPSRRRNRAGPDRRSRRSSTGESRRGPTTRRPRRGGLRAGRNRHLTRHTRRLVGDRS